MSDLTPERHARAQTKAQFAACGWTVQDYKIVDLSASRAIAVSEVPLTSGPCDHLLLVDRKSLGVDQGKMAGTSLSKVADQSTRYATNLPAFPAGGVIGIRPCRDPAPRSRRVFIVHRPESLFQWFAEPDRLRLRLARMPFAHPGRVKGRAHEQKPLRDHIANSLSIEPEDFEYAQFSQKGGLGKSRRMFGTGLNCFLDELNLPLVV